MHSSIRPHTHIALRLSSGRLNVLEITPNTNINLGKFGSFPANALLGRPYHLTYEIQDKEEGETQPRLRVVPAAELHAETLASDNADTPAESREEPSSTDGGVQYDIVSEDGSILMRNNRLTIDDPSRQTLTMSEIEELKKAETGSGKDIIAKIMASHMALDEKTKFSLAKYTLRKSRKYLKRFTVLPLDVGLLGEYVNEKEAFKVMELREEGLGLIGCWGNVFCGEGVRKVTGEDGVSQVGGGRWLVVDDTAGLLVAALAERMGILYPPTEEEDDEDDKEEEEVKSSEAPESGTTQAQKDETSKPQPDTEIPDPSPNTSDPPPKSTQEPNSTDPQPSSTTTQPPSSINPHPTPRRPRREHIPAMSATTNTLTVIHSNNQPNLALLKYFSFDHSNPTPSHPLHTHLKSLSWLQLLHPHEDPSYAEPEILPDEVLSTMKSSKRGTYYKKRRRWERTSRVVDEVRRGGYDGLVVATSMEVAGVLGKLVPLVRGGGKVVVYSANVEPLVELCDLYSKERRAAFVDRQFQSPQGEGKQNGNGDEDGEGEGEEGEWEKEFPVNPTMLLAPMLQTSRARHWQVLPGRTHPLMTSKGGAEGYVFTGTRVVPSEGKVEARGKFSGKKRRRVEREAVGS